MQKKKALKNQGFLAGAEGLEPSARGFGARTPLQYFQGFEAS